MTAVIYQIYKNGELIMETPDFNIMESYKERGYTIKEFYVDLNRKKYKERD